MSLLNPSPSIARRQHQQYHSQTKTMPTSPSDSNEPDPTAVSITICGDGGCGKSSITLRLVRSQWVSDYDPTIEDSYSLTRRINGVTYHLDIRDTAGQEEYRGMWASSSLGADAFLLVYDITNPDSLEQLQYFNDLIDIEAEMRADNAERARRAGLLGMVGTNPGSPVASGGSNGSVFGLGGASAKIVPPVKMVAGNKCDLVELRKISAAAGLEWARRHGCGFMETSARNEVNVEETFQLILERVAEARANMASGKINGEPDENKRGVTKPLTPLPPDEQEHHDQSQQEGLRRRRNGGGGSLGSPRSPRSARSVPKDEEVDDETSKRRRRFSRFFNALRCW